MPGFSSIKQPLKAAAKRYQLEDAFYQKKVFSQWQEAIRRLLPELAGLTEAIKFEKGVLTVACLTRAATHTIGEQTGPLMEFLNKSVGWNMVRVISLEF